MIGFYCERTVAGLWAEPLNVVTNAGFVLAAWGLRRLARERHAPAPAGALAWVALAIAIGSALFHMLATPRARVLDEAPILIFQLTWLWQYSRHVLRWTPAAAALLVLALAATTAAARFFAVAANGSVPYFPALGLSLWLGIDHLRANRPGRWLLLAGSGMFAAAIVLRSIDRAVCAAMPAGTHFLWHLLAAAVVYLFGRGLLVTRCASARPASGSISRP